MPRFDRTGPWGMGPMTGGGRGRCSPYGMAPGQGSFGPGSGWGRGRGRGYGRMSWAMETPGRWQAGPQASMGIPYDAPFSKEEEVASLKDQASVLKEELEVINRRVDQLESNKSNE